MLGLALAYLLKLLPLSISMYFPGNVHSEVHFPSGDTHAPLCLPLYLERTTERRKYFAKAEGHLPYRLFIANTQPYQPVKPCTLVRWLLVAMEGAAIDTSYKPHSSRSAGALELVRRGLSVTQIMARANLSENSETFHKFYNRA